MSPSYFFKYRTRAFNCLWDTVHVRVGSVDCIPTTALVYGVFLIEKNFTDLYKAPKGDEVGLREDR